MDRSTDTAVVNTMDNTMVNTMVNTGDVLKTSDVYRVDESLPERFNNPDCFRGYSTKRLHVRYQTTNQLYGSKKPTVHEMPTSFKGMSRHFSTSMLRSGMFCDSGFNVTLDKSRVMDTMATLNNRLYRHGNQHHSLDQYEHQHNLQDHHDNQHNLQDHHGS